jgi:2-(1,2-epoxy-1,2-dihydrophenyl)acetyl-CoA isomerase
MGVEKMVLTERVGPVVVLTLSRAARHNSLVPALLEEILVALERISHDPEVRAVILQAEGRSFSTGGDVAGFAAHLEDLAAYAGEIVGLLNQVILTLLGLPQPVVAAVQGMVTGGSLGLVLACDVVLLAPRATFAPYYGVVGFGPDGGWTAMLPAIIGTKRAAEVLLRNLTISAEQAVAWGLGSRIVPAETIRAEALSVAQEIAAKVPGSVRHIKRLLNLAQGHPGPGPGQGLASRLEAERTRFVEQIVTEEAREGIAAFLEGRRK